MNVYTLDMAIEYAHVERTLKLLGLLKTRPTKSITLKQSPPVKHSRAWVQCYPQMSTEVVRHLTKLTPVHTVNYVVDSELTPDVQQLLQERLSKYGASHFIDPKPFWFKITEESAEKQNKRICSSIINAIVSDSLHERALWLDSDGRRQQMRDLLEQLLLTADNFTTDEPMSVQMMRHLHDYPATLSPDSIPADASKIAQAQIPYPAGSVEGRKHGRPIVTQYGIEMTTLQLYFDKFKLHSNVEIHLPAAKWTSYPAVRIYPELHHVCPLTYEQDAFKMIGNFGGKPLLITLSGLLVIHLEEQTVKGKGGNLRLSTNVKILGRVTNLAKDVIIDIAAGCMGDIEVRTTELLDKMISSSESWREYKPTTVGTISMIEDLGDFRVNDWTRRMGDGTWNLEQ